MVDIPESRIGRGGLHASNAYGDMPDYMLIDKFASTDLIEDNDELRNYHRDMLMYSGPDPITREEEAPRRDLQSTQRLNLRTSGARSDAMPFMPDLFLGMTEKDPRGTTLDPDMRKYYDQSKFRGRYIRYYPDDDLSVPESARNESMIIRDRRAGFYPLKNRYKNFSTSKDGRSGPRPQPNKMPADRNMVVQDAEIIDLNHSTAPHRGDKTTILSNYTPIGWNTTPDAEFSVAQYGKVYSNVNAGDINIRGALNNQQTSTPDIVEFRGSLLPSAVVQVMKRIASERTEKLPPSFQQSIVRRLGNQNTQDRYNIASVDHKIISQVVSATARGQVPEKTTGIFRKAKESRARPTDAQLARNSSQQTPDAEGVYKSRRDTHVDTTKHNFAQTKNYKSHAPIVDNVILKSTRTALPSGRIYDDVALSRELLTANKDAHRYNTELDGEFGLTGQDFTRHSGRVENRSYTRSLTQQDDDDERLAMSDLTHKA